MESKLINKGAIETRSYIATNFIGSNIIAGPLNIQSESDLEELLKTRRK